MTSQFSTRSGLEVIILISYRESLEICFLFLFDSIICEFEDSISLIYFYSIYSIYLFSSSIPRDLLLKLLKTSINSLGIFYSKSISSFSEIKSDFIYFYYPFYSNFNCSFFYFFFLSRFLTCLFSCF